MPRETGVETDERQKGGEHAEEDPVHRNLALRVWVGRLHDYTLLKARPGSESGGLLSGGGLGRQVGEV
jgi:hypothetical protein